MKDAVARGDQVCTSERLWGVQQLVSGQQAWLAAVGAQLAAHPARCYPNSSNTTPLLLHSSLSHSQLIVGFPGNCVEFRN